MATDEKISQLTNGGQFQPTDQFAVSRSGASFRVQIPNGGLPAVNDAFIVVLSTSDPAANGIALLAAYTAAKALTPNGAALGATNRAVVIVPPGLYTLVTPLTLDTQFVDIIGATDQPSETIITSAITTASSGTIVQASGIGDVILRGLTIRNTGNTRSANDSTDAAAWHFFTNLSATKVTNCIFADGGLSWGMTQGAICNGTYTDCVGGDKTFGGSSGGEARGTYLRCIGGDNAFAGDSTVKSGAYFEGCQAGDNSFGSSVENNVNFVDCAGDSDAFGRSVFIGNARGCRSGTHGFGKGGFAGFAIDCIVNGNEGFGGNGAICQGMIIDCRCNGLAGFGGIGGTFSGRAYNCFSGDYSFGGDNGTFSGYAESCTFGDISAGANGGTFSGKMVDCTLATFAADSYPYSFPRWVNAWAPATFSGKITGVVFEPSGSNKNAVTIPNGATGEFEFCTLKKTGTGIPMALASGSATIKFSYCKFNTSAGIDAGITNSLGATLADAFCIGDTDV